VVLVVLAGINHALMAQTDTTIAIGMSPYQAYGQDSFGAINEVNGVLSGYIPLVSFPQKGSLNLTFYLQFTGGNVWQEFEELPDLNDDRFSVSPTNNFGPVITNNYGYFLQSNLETFPGSANFSIVNTLFDPQLGSHAMLYDATNLTSIRIYDGSGYAATDSSPVNVTFNPILLPNGTAINDSTIQDVDGNSIQFIAGSGGSGPPESIQDSAGRLIPDISTVASVTGGPQAFPSWATSSTTGCPSLGYSNQPLVGSFAWNVPGANGGTAPFLICYSQIHYSTEVDSVFSRGSSVEIQSVVLPNKTFWAFEYDSTNSSFSTNALGNIIQITNPDGGTASYAYAPYIPCSGKTDSALQGYGVQTKTISAGSGNSGTWSYQYFIPNGTNGIRSLITDPLGNQEEINYSQLQAGSCQYNPTSDIQYQGSMAGGVIAKQVTTNYFTTAALNVLNILTQSTITAIGGVSTTTNYQYGQTFQTTSPVCEVTCTAGTTVVVPYGMKTDENVIDFSGQKLRDITTHYEWQDNASYLASNIINAVDISTTFNGSEAQLSQTTTSFDEASFETNSGVRGHPTTVSISNNPGSPIVTHTAWTASGMVDHTVDGKGVTSEQYTYGSQYDGLYPTTITNALGQPTTYGYDFNTGQITSVTDPNGQTTTNTYYPYGWLQETQYPDHGSVQLTYSSDADPVSAQNPPAVTKTIATGESSGPIIQKTVYDGLGRVVQTQLTSDPAGEDIVATTYDPIGRVQSTSNPYRSTSDSTYGITTYTYDALNRMMVQTQPDNFTQTHSYNRNTDTFTDEANHSWQRTSDALGRLTNVVEPNGASTGYVYDALNNLLTVNQSGVSGETPRVRSFTYDSLSRLLTAMNPETGTISYSYDPNGNVMNKTDARGIATSYSYDALNRLTQKSYSDGTSTVLYGYDGSSISFVPPTGTRTTVALTNTIGRRFFASVEGGSSLYAFSYDAMGRVNNQWESMLSFSTTAAVYPVSVTYDLAGNRTSLTNSTGRTFNYTYDAAGQLQTASNTVSLNGTPVTTPMVSSMTYFPSGQPQTMTTDTGSATIIGTWGIDKRLRATSYQNLSTANTAGSNYGYSLTYTPNSNVLTDAETVYNPASGSMSWSWNFGYDSLNRLTSAQSAGAIQLGCAWTYDSFGNRLSQEPSGTGLSCTSLSTPVNANNHLSNPIYNYDAAGDILTEGGNTLTYDAEGRIKTGSGAFGVTTYNYGGDGQRASKMIAGFDESDYIRDPDGSLLTTYVAGSYFGEFQDMWVGGKHFGEVSVASGNASQTQNFALNNWLGSLVAYASPSSGIPNTAYVSQSFGDAQTALFGSNNDSIRFTGKEIDGESGNNYFGARYYASNIGRFMSPDWSDDPDPIPFADMDDPQSLNLYSYVGNNPLSNVDDDGHDYYLQGGSQCGQNGVSCDANGYVLGSDGNRQVVTDAQTQNGGAILSQGANGGVNVTIGTGTFAGEFFDATPNAVSMVVNSDESLAPSAQAFANDVGGYANAAMPLISAQLGLTADLAGFELPVAHLAVTLGAARSKGTASHAAGSIPRKPGSLGQFGKNGPTNKVARDIWKTLRNSGATEREVHDALQEASQDAGRALNYTEGLQEVKSILGLF
jgi:RHS repeat-associated protein